MVVDAQLNDWLSWQPAPGWGHVCVWGRHSLAGAKLACSIVMHWLQPAPQHCSGRSVWWYLWSRQSSSSGEARLALVCLIRRVGICTDQRYCHTDLLRCLALGGHLVWVSCNNKGHPGPGSTAELLGLAQSGAVWQSFLQPGLILSCGVIHWCKLQQTYAPSCAQTRCWRWRHKFVALPCKVVSCKLTCVFPDRLLL